MCMSQGSGMVYDTRHLSDGILLVPSPFRRSPLSPPPGIIDGAHLPRLIYNIILCRRNIYTCIYTEPARLCNRNTLLESRPLWAANARPRAVLVDVYINVVTYRRSFSAACSNDLVRIYFIIYNTVRLTYLLGVYTRIMYNIIIYIFNCSLYIVYSPRVLISDLHGSFFMPSKRFFAILQR